MRPLKSLWLLGITISVLCHCAKERPETIPITEDLLFSTPFHVEKEDLESIDRLIDLMQTKLHSLNGSLYIDPIYYPVYPEKIISPINGKEYPYASQPDEPVLTEKMVADINRHTLGDFIVFFRCMCSFRAVISKDNVVTFSRNGSEYIFDGEIDRQYRYDIGSWFAHEAHPIHFRK